MFVLFVLFAFVCFRIYVASLELSKRSQATLAPGTMSGRAIHGQAWTGAALSSYSLFGIPGQRVAARRYYGLFAPKLPIRSKCARLYPSCSPVRGAKTRSTVKLKDISLGLPQGALKLEAYNDGSDDIPRYPTVVQGHRNNMEKFKNCVVLTRVGGFYEV